MDEEDADTSESANTYSTGGGGTVLEHRYGAVLLSHVLTHKPLPALGDHLTPTRIRFQASPESPVDDLLVFGTDGLGEEYRLSIGVRHNPQLTKRNKPSVKLIQTYLATVVQHWPDIETGRWKLAIAVMASSPAANQLKALTQAAAGAGSNAAFRVDLATPRRHNEHVRNRLTQLDAIVDEITSKPEFATTDVKHPELTWRLLSKLSVIEPRLEGADQSDRTAAVERLMQVTPDGTASSADSLYSRLAEKVGDYAPSGTRVDYERLCADLRGLAFFKQPEDEQLPTADADSISAGVRAEALALGPIEAISGLEDLYEQAGRAVESDPGTAARLFEQVASELDKKGFRGHATLLRRRAANLIEAAGHRETAVEILTVLVEHLIDQGAEHEARLPANNLARAAGTDGTPHEINNMAHEATTLYQAAAHPFDDLSALASTFDTLDNAVPGRRATYTKVLCEAAVATRQFGIIIDRVDAITRAAHETDRLTETRIKIAVAEATGEWDKLVRQAKTHRIRRPLAALILARYARHLTLTGQPDEAAEHWHEAIQRGALAEIGDDTAEWLYALRDNFVLYGPVTAETETHPLAQAMRLTGGTITRRHRDHYNDALGDLHYQRLPDACESARKALRDAVTYGHLTSEMMAAELLADIYAASGEAVRAAELYVRSGQSTEKLRGLFTHIGDQYIDLEHYLDSPMPWERRAALEAAAAQADLMPDDHVEAVVEHAIKDFADAHAGRIRERFPYIARAALAVIASLIERATPAQAQDVIQRLEPLVPREPNHYHLTDEAHVRALAGMLGRDDDSAPGAAKQLLALLALNESVSHQVFKIAGDAISRRIDLFRDELPPMIDDSPAAAWLLASVGIEPPAASVAVQQAFDILTKPYEEAGGKVSLGQPLGHYALLVRHKPRADCEAAVKALLVRARDRNQPALNRGNAVDALRALSSSVAPATRAELFQAGLSFAQGHEDGSALDELTGTPIRLSASR